MSSGGKPFRRVWLPKLESGGISFAIEMLVVIVVGVIGFAVAGLALWVF